jgi:methionine aminopeptidase
MIEKSTPSAVERVSGSLATEAALTVVAAISGGPLAPLLPVLSKSLAAARQKARVEAELKAIHEVLASQAARVEALSDEQYKVVNETVLAVLQTTQEQKLKLLRNAVANALAADIGHAREAAMLSRIIRDISAEEAAFLATAFAYDGVQPMETQPGEAFEDNGVSGVRSAGSSLHICPAV